MGLIGHNGAGKSTLLKIISRLTRPTHGKVAVRGRIGSMLELGVGFHNELTGRENVYLSGVILGMSRAEIRRRFDEIVAFSGVESMLDQPVKRYSSGMRVRLAFSVMTTLDPEILLIDEVLGVGDAQFQQRSLQRMRDLIKSGRTVLFVSHNTKAVARLCERTIQLAEGRVVHMGETEQVVTQYQREANRQDVVQGDGTAEFEPKRWEAMSLRRVELLNDAGEPTSEMELSQPLRVRLTYDVNWDVPRVHVLLKVETTEGTCVLATGDADDTPERFERVRKKGSYTTTVTIPPRRLEAGRYQLTISMGEPYVKIHDRQRAAVQFDVIDESSNRRLWYQDTRPGLQGEEHHWEYGVGPWE